ncbi:MAG: hypothetical protein WCJ72_14340 [Chryseobacterium sp.]
MYHKYLTDKSFFEFLYQTDQDLARQTKEKGCHLCGSKVHVANYMRKPRGIDDLPDDFSLCFSFCCSRDGCRKRALPQSIRFLGRFVYWSVHVVLISAMLNGRTAELEKITSEFNIDIKTLKRWRKWWKDIFPTTKLWKKIKGGLCEDVDLFPLGFLMILLKNNLENDAIIKLLHLLNGLKEPI